MKKKLVQINVVCNGSTGKIMNQIQAEAQKQEWDAYSFYGRGNPANDKCIKIGNKLDVLWHVLITRLFDKHGHGSKRATKKLVKQIEEIDPDVIQLHNIHGYYIHLETLFSYLKRSNKKIVWTLHDFWAITGHCSYFTYPKCEKWQEQCGDCIRKTDYPKSFMCDSSKKEYLFKKKLFTGIKDLTIVTPSNWVAELVKKSFLKEYEINVINNGIDLNIFKSTNTVDVRKKYNISKDRKIILGVASVWEQRKGLDDFIELSKNIPQEYIIVLIGLNNKQIKKLPNTVIGIERTENLEELVNFYTTAEIFYNPSKEETFSLVTIEAMACGTTVIAYNNSAVKELIETTGNGILIDINNSKEKNIQEIKKYLNKNKEVARIEQYSIEKMTNRYINIYKE